MLEVVEQDLSVEALHHLAGDCIRGVFGGTRLLLPCSAAATTAAEAAASSRAGRGRGCKGTGETVLEVGESETGGSYHGPVVAGAVEAAALGDLGWGVEAGGGHYLFGNAERDAVDQELLPEGERGRGSFLHAAEVVQVAAEGLPAGVQQGTLLRASHPGLVQERATEDAPGYHPDDRGPYDEEDEVGEHQGDHGPDAQSEEGEHEPHDAGQP